MIQNYSIQHGKLNFCLKYLIAFFLFTGSQTCLNAQSKGFENSIKTFQNYSEAYRETVYSHLNKTILIKGETLGFSSYVLNKDLKKPSHLTKNLYCVITDSNNKTIKSKLVKVENGFSNNVFGIDSLFTSGEYTFKAYTNWMKNFDEQDAFVETFKVIDPEVEKVIKRKIVKNKIDAQFLPEGGHFVNSVKTNVGVVIKDSEGYGISNASGVVLDKKNQTVTTFKTNSLGIGRFFLTPKMDENYIVEVKNLDTTFQFEINNIKERGISVSLNDLKSKIALEFKTNTTTLNQIKGKAYKLAFHNGKNIKAIDVLFKSESLVKIIDIKDLFSGINIFTLFDENNNPILERLFFNYEGINFIRSAKPSIAKSRDSLKIQIPYKALKSLKNTNVSVSVLPEETKSYQRHHNIVSYALLQPYVNGYIENAAYYFTDINGKKKYDLDNLLITQGWSSYNWNTIFNSTNANNFAFEDGITIQVNNNNNGPSSFIIYPLENNQGFLVDLPENEKKITKSGFYPESDEKLNLATLNRKGKVKKSNFYTRFYPSKIPTFNIHTKPLSLKGLTYTKYTEATPFVIDFNKAQELDEVVVKTDLRQTKINMLKGSSWNKVYLFDDAKRAMNLTLENYINSYVVGFYANWSDGELKIESRTDGSLIGSSTPIIYLDDVRLSSNEFLINFDMSRVDYIVVNRHGFGEGMLGANGAIKIYTSNLFPGKNKNQSFRAYEFPIAFSKNKNFYIPKYTSYTDDFFKEYGVIDWIPNCKTDNLGNLNLTIHNSGNNNVKLFIEGLTQDGSFISETKVIKFTDSQ